MPEWTHRPFWRRIESGAWRRRVALDFYLEPDAIEANPENAEHCFIGDGPFNSRLRVMRTKKLCGGTADACIGVSRDRGLGSSSKDDCSFERRGNPGPSEQPCEKRKRNRARRPSRSQRRRQMDAQVAGLQPSASSAL